MKKFIKKNFVLVLGISLPVVLILAFVIAKGLTQLVDPPQYQPVFAIQRNYLGTELFQFEIRDDGKLTVIFEAPPNEKFIAYNYFARVYIFNPKTNKLKYVDVRPPEDFEFNKKIAFDLPENYKYLTFLSDPKTPDGYVFEQNTRSGGGIFTDIFGYRSRNKSRYLLTKKGRSFPVAQENMNYGRFTFIGWVDKG